jgi:predicted pyridoxine 5'-phosphate oxidase superfamily flavin-nucleotide-binding protein
MTDTIATIAELEACIGTSSLGTQMKIIDHLDGGAAAWIAAAPFAFVGFAGSGAPAVTLAGGAPGFASVHGERSLSLPRAALDDGALGEAGQGVGVLFLVPGTGETLRVNGRVTAVTGEAIAVAVDECFLHCAKALIRSDFWAAPEAETPDDAEGFLAASRFLALATADDSGGADMSPKGDPAGLLVRLAGGVVTLAERPGNKLAFGYRNMLAHPAVAAVALVPGSTKVALFIGTARLSTDAAAREAFTVDGKAPNLVTEIVGTTPVIRESRALRAAALWPARATSAIDPAAVLVGHVKLNKAKGEMADAIRAGVARDAVAQGLAQSYEHKLY